MRQCVLLLSFIRVRSFRFLFAFVSRCRGASRRSLRFAVLLSPPLLASLTSPTPHSIQHQIAPACAVANVLHPASPPASRVLGTYSSSSVRTCLRSHWYWHLCAWVLCVGVGVLLPSFIYSRPAQCRVPCAVLLVERRARPLRVHVGVRGVAVCVLTRTLALAFAFACTRRHPLESQSSLFVFPSSCSLARIRIRVGVHFCVGVRVPFVFLVFMFMFPSSLHLHSCSLVPFAFAFAFTLVFVPRPRVLESLDLASEVVG